jgi:hypothetical protein
MKEEEESEESEDDDDFLNSFGSCMGLGIGL